jgi:hypothetical protein
MGGNEHDNRVTVCAFHHLRGIHAGTFRVTGRVSKGLIWEVGIRPRRSPLMRCAGDTYAHAKEVDAADAIIAIRDDAPPDTMLTAVA